MVLSRLILICISISLFPKRPVEKHSQSISAGADCAHNLAESVVFFGSMLWFRRWWGFIKGRTKSVLEQMSLAVVVADAWVERVKAKAKRSPCVIKSGSDISSF